MFRIFKKLSKRHRLVGNYRKSTNENKNVCLDFLLKNYRDICKYHSFSTFKEMTLNYRILYDRHNKNKIIHDYKTYILTKSKKHRSNLAISYNMIKTVKVDEELEKEIIDYMYSQVDTPHIAMYKDKSFLVKRNVMLYFVRLTILTRLPV